MFIEIDGVLINTDKVCWVHEVVYYNDDLEYTFSGSMPEDVEFIRKTKIGFDGGFIKEVDSEYLDVKRKIFLATR